VDHACPAADGTGSESALEEALPDGPLPDNGVPDGPEVRLPVDGDDAGAGGADDDAAGQAPDSGVRAPLRRGAGGSGCAMSAPAPTLPLWLGLLPLAWLGYRRRTRSR
jgi:hypothetical protein